MESFIILGVMLLAIFGSMIVFAIVGYKALTQLAKRPGQGGKVMIPLILKLMVTSAVIFGLLMFIMEIFG